MQEGVARYFIAIVPPSPVYEQALAIKNEFKEKYNSRAALRSPPHLTLHMPFEWKLKKEQILIGGLVSFAKSRVPFKLQIKGFDSFAPRVIFLRFDESESLRSLQKELTRFCKVEFDIFNADYKDQPFHPHLTVAFRDLKKSQFAQAWSEFKDRPFDASFLVDRITLLRHDGAKWVPLHEAIF